MKRLNSKFTDAQLKIIFSKDQKFRLYCAILFKYYEIHNIFFQNPHKISGSLLQNIASKLHLENSNIEIPSERAINTYKANIRRYFNVSNLKVHKIKLIAYLKSIITSEGISEYDTLKEREQ